MVVQEAAAGAEIGVIEQFIAQHRAYRSAQRREELRRHWQALENPLTAAYLQSQAKTENWTT